MFRSFLKTLLIVCVALSILYPQGSALLARLGLSDGQVIVICTGDGLRTVQIGADGQPLQTSDKAEFCALVQTVDTAAGIAPSARPAPLVLTLARRFEGARPTPEAHATHTLARAPPAA